MLPDELYQSRKADWERLTHLLDRTQRSSRSLSHAEVLELGNLYRSLTSDLAVAQRDFPTHRITLYLNSLVARAHSQVYRSEPLVWKRLWHFVWAGYPRLYRRNGVFIAIAGLLLVLPAIAAGLMIHARPESAEWLLPAEYQRLIPMVEQSELWVDIPINERPFASSFIMTNNIRVAFLAFGSGVLLGLPTVYVMLLNGLILGGVTGLTAHYGIGDDLWNFVIGHGVVELSVIVLAGGAGLMLGWAILHPGLLRRQEALAQAARDAVRLVAGCVPLLMIAGLIEGFISPSETIQPWFKWLVGLGAGALLYAYLLLAGRKPDPAS